jgi:hypothetical protein
VSAMDEETRERGLANIRAIRARMHRSGPDGETKGAEAVAAHAPAVMPATPTDEMDDPAAMAAAMAAGAERDRLEQRVAELEREVRRLRVALGRVLREVAGAMDGPDGSELERSADTSSGAGS